MSIGKALVGVRGGVFLGGSEDLEGSTSSVGTRSADWTGINSRRICGKDRQYGIEDSQSMYIYRNFGLHTKNTCPQDNFSKFRT